MRRVVRILLLIVLLALAVLLGLAAYVMTAGIPGPVVRHYLSRVESTRGLRIAADRVRWSPWHNISARGLRVYAPGGKVTVECDSLVLDVNGGFADLAGVEITFRATGEENKAVDAAGHRRARLDRLAASFVREGDHVRITDATAALHGGGPTRTVRGQGTLGSGGVFNISLTSDASPGQMAAFLPSAIAPLAASFETRGISHTAATLSRGASGSTNVAVHGVIHAADVVRNDVHVDLIHAGFAYSNGILQVEDLAVVRQDGQVTGRVQYKLADKLLSVDGRVTAPPTAIARFVGPGLERLVTPYRFEGPTTIEYRGTTGLKGNPTRDLRLHVEGRRVGWRWFLPDHVALEVVIGEQAIVLRDLNADWCGGDVSGSLRFDRPIQTNAARRCSMDLSVSGANLASIVDIFRDLEDRKAYEGFLSGQIVLSGNADSRFLDTAIGYGRLDIQDGYILSIPLFGGLSRYLSLLIPGLGYASQRDLRGSFRIRDGRLETNDAQLLGKIITIHGKGSYGFNKDINARVQLRFLKEGLTATVTRLVTSPLTKALEFELTGTTREPRWRPVNTPDRLLRFFTENLGKLVPAKGASQ